MGEKNDDNEIIGADSEVEWYSVLLSANSAGTEFKVPIQCR
jgi:hypothetical protein